MSRVAPTTRADPPPRPVLRPRAVVSAVAVVTLATGAFLLLRPHLPAAWSTPGSGPLYLTGVAAAALLLVPFAFAGVKRTGLTRSPPAWFVAHVLASTTGLGLALVHCALNLDRAPALLILAAGFLVLQGTWAQWVVPHALAGVFGTRHRSFRQHAAVDRTRLEALIADKQRLLARLDPAASEAVFSLRPGHWLHHPALSWRYASLARGERAILAPVLDVSPALLWWRRIHMVVAWLFLLGLAMHVVTVTFFAGYVADGAPVDWWHLRAWGAPR